MQRLVSVSREKHRPSSINEQLVECWSTVVNPFSTTIYILENMHQLETGKSNGWIWIY